jgi:SAM-dependent methyltransferase
MTSQVDTLELYRWAVQDPETHAIVLRKMYERLRPGRQAVILREDFAGTSADSVAWIDLRRGRRAIAVDLDGPTLDWAQRRANRLLGTRASELCFVQADVCDIGPPDVPKADIIAVLNYSIFHLRERDELQSYLRQTVTGLAPNGMLVLNIFGGSDRVRPGTTRRRVVPNPRLPSELPFPEFDYFWEVRHYDEATARLECRIHFAVPDQAAPGQMREVRDAFRYDWRLWSIEELLETCTRAGFSNVEVWRHTYDPSKGDAGVFLGPVEPESICELDEWSAYIIASI